MITHRPVEKSLRQFMLNVNLKRSKIYAFYFKRSEKSSYAVLVEKQKIYNIYKKCFALHVLGLYC